MNYVTTADSTRLCFKDWVAGSPVILIRGWPLSADSWNVEAMALAEAGNRVVAARLRSLIAALGRLRLRAFADDLAARITQTGVQDAVLVGLSIGGGPGHRGLHIDRVCGRADGRDRDDRDRISHRPGAGR